MNRIMGMMRFNITRPKTLWQSLCHQKRLLVDTDILSFWEDNKNIDLYELAQVVLAAQCTQVSVKRAFSGLTLIITDKRIGLMETIF